MNRRQFMKGLAMAAVSANFVKVPMISSLTPAAKLAAFDALDYAIADMMVNISLANYFKGVQFSDGRSFGNHQQKAFYQAKLVRRLMDNRNIDYLT